MNNMAETFKEKIIKSAFSHDNSAMTFSADDVTVKAYVTSMQKSPKGFSVSLKLYFPDGSRLPVSCWVRDA